MVPPWFLLTVREPERVNERQLRGWRRLNGGIVSIVCKHNVSRSGSRQGHQFARDLSTGRKRRNSRGSIETLAPRLEDGIVAAGQEPGRRRRRRLRMSGIGALGRRTPGKRDRTCAHQEVKSIESRWTTYFEPSIAIRGNQVGVTYFNVISIFGCARSRKQNGGRSRRPLVDHVEISINLAGEPEAQNIAVAENRVLRNSLDSVSLSLFESNREKAWGAWTLRVHMGRGQSDEQNEQ
jgi:hypothetical protein